ncbi:MAG: hypothetical protein AAF598_04565, partial [Bacteroidota bacterium]
MLQDILDSGFHELETLNFNLDLRNGEQLLWTGQPKQGLIAVPGEWMYISFSGFLGIIAGLSIHAAWTRPVFLETPMDPILITIFMLPTFGVGVFGVFLRFFLSERLRAHTFYAITNKRVCWVNTFRGGRSFELSLNRLPKMTIEAVDGTRGTIRFHQEKGPKVFSQVTS